MRDRLSRRLQPTTAAELGRIVRFATVGVVGVVVNSLLLWVLTDRAAMYYLVSSAIATEVAILCNFALNHTWTFAAQRDGETFARRLLKFNLVSFGGLALTVTMLFVFKQFAGLHYLVANAAAVAFASTWNYVANRRWTWRAAVVSGT